MNFTFKKRRGGTFLKCFPNPNFFGEGIKAFQLRPGGLDLFFGLFVPKGGGSFRGGIINNLVFELSIGEIFSRMISLLDQIPEAFQNLIAD